MTRSWFASPWRPPGADPRSSPPRGRGEKDRCLMNKALLVLLAAGVVSAAADAPGGEDAARDLRRMQGDWAAESYVQDGTKLPDDDAQAIFRTVKGDKYTVSHFKRVLGKGTIKLDASKKPKAIDAY